MNGKWLIGSLVGVFAWSAMAGDAPKNLHLGHAWRVQIGADGKVLDVTDADPDNELALAVRKPLERAIRGWPFVPGTENGKPAITETGVSVNMTLVPSAGNTYAVCVDSVSTGSSLDTRSVRTKHPQFPQGLAFNLSRTSSSFVGRVVVKVDYDAEGRILTATPEPGMSMNSRPELVASAVDAVRKWKMRPERVDGHGIAASVWIPICYSYGASQAQKDACAWMPPGAKSGIGSGSAHAIDPVAKLAGDVVGTTCHPVPG
jgi:hypothetical protein